MELKDEFSVDLPVDQAFQLLADVERIAPCMPGAELTEVSGEEYHGTVKVKVGPITAQYKGVARFLEQDGTAHRMVLRAEGRETRGQGNASATVTAQLEAVGGSTRVSVVTDLTISGKVAQFGRGVLAEVSTKLLGQFVQCLETSVLAAGASAAEQPAGADAIGRPAADDGRSDSENPLGSGENGAANDTLTTVEPRSGAPRPGGPSAGQASAPEAGGAVDLVRIVGPSLLKRAVPLLGLAVIIAILVALGRGRDSRR